MNVVRGKRSVKLREKLKSVKIQSTANLFQGVVPANITLKAVPVGFTAKSYTWTLNEIKIGTNQSFIIANNQVENVNTYKVVVTATDDSTYEETISIAKVRDGSAIVALKRYLDEIMTRHKQLDANYNSLYNNPKIGNYKGTLSNVYNNYKTSYTELVNFINAIIAQNSFSPAEEATLNNYIANYRLKLADLVNALETALKLTTDYLDDTIKRINQITSFLDTTINGNVVATGVVLVGDGNEGTGGMSGIRDQGQESIFLYSGQTFNNRYSAPFRVTHGGSVVMTNAYVSGHVTATSGTFSGRIEAQTGYIGGFTLEDKLLKTTDINSGIWFTHENDNYKSSIRMGNNIGTGILPEQNYYPFLMIQNQAKKVVTPWESFKAGIHLDMKSFNDDIQSYPAIEVKNGYYQGLAFNTETFTSGQTINRDTDFGYVASNNGSSPIIKLPKNPRQGKFLILINPTENNITTIEGNGKKIGYKFSSEMAAMQFTKSAILIFSGNMWYIITTS